MKSKKDIAQAAQLIEVLFSERAGDIWMAMDAANQYPSEKFKKTLIDKINLLPSNLSSEILDYWKSIQKK